MEDPAFVWNRPPRPAGPQASTPAGPPASSGDTPSAPASDAPPAAEVGMASPDPAPQRPDAVLVPLDQWSRILNQLGNLHDAGQQLAEARERAARAETESAFLRERLKDLRAKIDDMELAAAEPPPEPEPAPPFGVWFLRRRLDRRRSR